MTLLLGCDKVNKTKSIRKGEIYAKDTMERLEVVGVFGYVSVLFYGIFEFARKGSGGKCADTRA